MTRLAKLADRLDAVIGFVGRLARWLVLPLIAVTIFDVITRKIYWTQQLIANSWAFDYLSSQHLQDWEWQLHTALFLLVLGYAYIRNGHVRVDIVRETLSERKRAWVELIGTLLCLIPYAAVLLYFAVPFVRTSFIFDEQSSSFSGLGHRWAIKSFLIAGFALALLAGLSVFLRSLVTLFGPTPPQDRPNAADGPAAQSADDAEG